MSFIRMFIISCMVGMIAYIFNHYTSSKDSNILHTLHTIDNMNYMNYLYNKENILKISNNQQNRNGIILFTQSNTKYLIKSAIHLARQGYYVLLPYTTEDMGRYHFNSTNYTKDLHIYDSPTTSNPNPNPNPNPNSNTTD